MKGIFTILLKSSLQMGESFIDVQNGVLRDGLKEILLDELKKVLLANMMRILVIYMDEIFISKI